MALKDIREDLARKDSEYAEREHRTTKFNEWQVAEDHQSDTSLWQRTRASIAASRYRAVIVGAAAVFGLIVLAFLVIAVVEFQRGYFAQERTTLAIDTVSETPSNRAIEVAFDYHNDNRATLENAEVVVQFGAYFVPAEGQDNFTRTDDLSGVLRIGEVAGGARGRVVLVGHFVAPERETEVIGGTLAYDVRSRRHESRTDTVVKITSSPLVVDILAPQTIISGNTIDLKVFYRNRGTEPIEGVALGMDYPAGFLYRDALPRPDDGQMTWEVGTLAPGEQGEISVRGVLQGDTGQVRSFTAALLRESDQRATFARDIHNFEIAPAPIMIAQQIGGIRDGVARARDRMDYVITYRNDSNIPLRDVILRTYLDSSILSLEELYVADRGFYDPERRLIEWKAADIPELKVLNPGEGGRVHFSVSVKNRVPITEAYDENLTITSLVEMESLDIPDLLRENKNVFGNTLVTKVGTKLLLDVETERVAGPYPLIVGDPTTYRVTMSVGTVSNDVSRGAVSLLLPGGVSFVGQDENTADFVEHNARTNEIVWNVGSLDHGVGVTLPHRRVTFDVRVDRSLNQNDNLILVLDQIRFEGEDRFTGITEAVKADNVMTHR